MKTFIWNTEYEVWIANANTVEKARELLIPHVNEFFDPSLQQRIDQAERYKQQYPDPSYISPSSLYLYRDEEWWKKEIEYRRESIKREKALLFEDPHIIIEENQGMIFSHGNE